jgi:flavin reductase (DIM6/NTAB) family NADH-FMN oxidoreductase RutF
MDDAAKKTALRMIPYGIYVLSARASDGTPHAATVNWVTQTAFSPPLIAIAVKADSGVYAALKASRKGALSILGKGQTGVAFTFFKPVVAEGATLSGEAAHDSPGGAPILDSAAASLDLSVVEIVERGDHHVFIAEVTAATVAHPIEGRPDDAVLAMRDLGDKVFYGG